MKLLSTGLSAATINLLFSYTAYAEINQAVNCDNTARPYRVTARHIDPNGIGYNQGYTTLEGFFPLYNDWEKWVFFLDTRAHVFNNGKPAVNAGIGTRYLTNNHGIFIRKI